MHSNETIRIQRDKGIFGPKTIRIQRDKGVFGPRQANLVLIGYARCSLIQAVNQEEPSDRKPDP